MKQKFAETVGYLGGWVPSKFNIPRASLLCKLTFSTTMDTMTLPANTIVLSCNSSTAFTTQCWCQCGKLKQNVIQVDDRWRLHVTFGFTFTFY